MVAIIACFALCRGLNLQSLRAEEPYDRLAPFVPEAMVAPIKKGEGAVQSLGWMLVYRNQFTTPDTSISEVQSQAVKFRGPLGNQIDGDISWIIEHSENSSCIDHDGGPCPDVIRVLSVPDGFIAVPNSALVSERNKLLIYIVREESG